MKKRLALGVVSLMALGLGVLLGFGGGHASVFAQGKKLDVYLDDQLLGAVEAGTAHRFRIPHGTHHLRAGRTEWRVEVDRWFDQVLPIDGQCFVQFDVTNLLYDQVSGPREDVRATAALDNPVAGRFFQSEPFDMPERTWLELYEIPEKRTYLERVSVLRLVPCSKRDATDEELSELAPHPFLHFQF